MKIDWKYLTLWWTFRYIQIIIYNQTVCRLKIESQLVSTLCQTNGQLNNIDHYLVAEIVKYRTYFNSWIDLKSKYTQICEMVNISLNIYGLITKQLYWIINASWYLLNLWQRPSPILVKYLFVTVLISERHALSFRARVGCYLIHDFYINLHSPWWVKRHFPFSQSVLPHLILPKTTRRLR